MNKDRIVSTNKKIKNQATKSNKGIATTALGYADGLSCLFKGLNFVYVKHRELAIFYLPPMFLALFFVIGAAVGMWFASDLLVNLLWDEPAPGLWHMLWSFISFVLWLVVSVATTILTLFIFTLFAAPFNDLLSERIEGLLGTWKPKPFSVKFLISDLGQTILFELGRLRIKLAWMLPLFLFSFVPVVGPIVYFVFGSYFLTKYTGMDYIDWCAARRGWSWTERIDFANKNRGALCGLGTGVAISLIIPIFFIIIWPGAVAGGAMLFTSLHSDDITKAPSAPGEGDLLLKAKK